MSRLDLKILVPKLHFVQLNFGTKICGTIVTYLTLKSYFKKTNWFIIII